MIRIMVALIITIPLTGCLSQIALIKQDPAILGCTTATYKDLVSLPSPEGKIVAAVYKFKDQTGQYKSPFNITYSTAVTQGATSILIKTLEDSGWFIPVEREGLQDLLNERKIIQSNISNNNETLLPPLVPASIILEGGIISHDTNTITGGFGTRYFGIGGSTEFQKDMVTIYLRAIDIRDGSIIKSVTTNKTILSKKMDLGVYKFVKLKRLLEVETGFSTNEPRQICVLEAIEKAVYSLIIEGILDKHWALRNPEDIKSPVIQKYIMEREGVKEEISFKHKRNLLKVKDG